MVFMPLYRCTALQRTDLLRCALSITLRCAAAAAAAAAAACVGLQTSSRRLAAAALATVPPRSQSESYQSGNWRST